MTISLVAGGVPGMARAAPKRPPEKLIEFVIPRSFIGSQEQNARANVGYPPDSPTPNRNRRPIMGSNPRTTPVKAVISDHAIQTTVMTTRGPKRSASLPLGT